MNRKIADSKNNKNLFNHPEKNIALVFANQRLFVGNESREQGYDAQKARYVKREHSGFLLLKLPFYIRPIALVKFFFLFSFYSHFFPHPLTPSPKERRNKG